MPDLQRPLKVFLSYASQDRPLVRELSRRLVGEGWIDTWVDEKSLLPGQDWRVKIEEAVEEADAVIICLSNHSVSKEGHVQKELRYAREIALEKPEETIFLIPLRLEECEVPRGLRFYQWVDYFGDAKNNSYNALVKSLKLRYEQKLRLEEIENSREEKARLEAEELARQKAEKEKIERGAAEKVAQEKIEKETQRRLEISIKKAKRDLWWKKLKTDINYRLEIIRIYRVPILISLVALVIIIPLSLDLANKIPESSQTLNKTPISTVALTAQLIIPSHTSKPNLKPTETLLPSKTPVASVTPTATTLPAEITDAKDVSMILVPAGSFLMGYNKGTVAEDPQDTRFVDAFYIDKYETTNGQYKECVASGTCALPNKGTSNSHDDYYENSKFNNYPVINVDWYMASAYCSWRDARLPTELEWEKAARGDDGRLYPWGDQVNYQYANYYNYKNDTTEVGSYEIGKSVYGVYDMSGNVREWVSSLFLEYPYKTNDGRETPNANGPRVFRGGAWSSASVAELRTSYRSGASPSASFLSLGFRCARSAP